MFENTESNVLRNFTAPGHADDRSTSVNPNKLSQAK